MKNRIRFAITLAGAVLCALPNLAMAQSGQNGDSQGGQAAAIEGTWIFSIHRVVTGINFTALQSFTAGGVTLATGSGDRLPAPTMRPYSPPISPLYGSWRSVDDNTYVATINFFAFDSAGNPVAMIQNTETLRLKDDNTITGTGTAFQCYVDGSNCMVLPPFAISFCGKRLTAGSLAPAACVQGS
jgi:hypothetical protein